MREKHEELHACTTRCKNDKTQHMPSVKKQCGAAVVDVQLY